MLAPGRRARAGSRPRARSSRAASMPSGSCDLLQAQHELVAGARVQRRRPSRTACRRCRCSAPRALNMRVEHRRARRGASKRAAAARSASAPPARSPRRRRAPCASRRAAGSGMSKASSPTVLRERVELHAAATRGRWRACPSTASSRRAPRPRGCSAPLTHTSNGVRRAASSTWPTKSAKRPSGRLDHVGPRRGCRRGARGGPASAGSRAPAAAAP